MDNFFGNTLFNRNIVDNIFGNTSCKPNIMLILKTTSCVICISRKLKYLKNEARESKTER